MESVRRQHSSNPFLLAEARCARRHSGKVFSPRSMPMLRKGFRRTHKRVSTSASLNDDTGSTQTPTELLPEDAGCASASAPAQRESNTDGDGEFRPSGAASVAGDSLPVTAPFGRCGGRIADTGSQRPLSRFPQEPRIGHSPTDVPAHRPASAAVSSISTTNNSILSTMVATMLPTLGNRLRLSEGLSCVDYLPAFRALAVGSTRQLHILEVVPAVAYELLRRQSESVGNHSNTQNSHAHEPPSAASFHGLRRDTLEQQHQKQRGSSSSPSSQPDLGAHPYVLRNAGVFGGLVKVDSVAWYPSTEEASLAFIQPGRSITILLDALQFKADGTYVPQQYTRSQGKGKSLHAITAVGSGSTEAAVVNTTFGAPNATPLTEASTGLAAVEGSFAFSPPPSPGRGVLRSPMAAGSFVLRDPKGPLARELIELSIDITYVRVERIIWDPHSSYTLAVSSPATHFELWQVLTDGHAVYAPQLVLRPPAHNTRSLVRDIAFSPSDRNLIVVVVEMASVGQVLLYDRRQVVLPRVVKTSGPGLTAAFHPVFTDLLAVSYRKEKTRQDCHVAFLRVYDSQVEGRHHSRPLAASSPVSHTQLPPSSLPHQQPTGGGTEVRSAEDGVARTGTAAPHLCDPPHAVQQNVLQPIDYYASINRLRWRPPSCGTLSKPHPHHHYINFAPSIETCFGIPRQHVATQEENPRGSNRHREGLARIASHLWFATLTTSPDVDLSVWDATNGFFPICALSYPVKEAPSDFAWVNELTLVSVFKGSEIVITSLLNNPIDESVNLLASSPPKSPRNLSSPPMHTPPDSIGLLTRRLTGDKNFFASDTAVRVFSLHTILPTATVVADLFGHSFVVRSTSTSLKRNYQRVLQAECANLVLRHVAQVAMEEEQHARIAQRRQTTPLNPRGGSGGVASARRTPAIVPAAVAASFHISRPLGNSQDSSQRSTPSAAVALQSTHRNSSVVPSLGSGGTATHPSRLSAPSLRFETLQPLVPLIARLFGFHKRPQPSRTPHSTSPVTAPGLTRETAALPHAPPSATPHVVTTTAAAIANPLELHSAPASRVTSHPRRGLTPQHVPMLWPTFGIGAAHSAPEEDGRPPQHSSSTDEAIVAFTGAAVCTSPYYAEGTHGSPSDSSVSTTGTMLLSRYAQLFTLLEHAAQLQLLQRHSGPTSQLTSPHRVTTSPTILSGGGETFGGPLSSSSGGAAALSPITPLMHTRPSGFSFPPSPSSFAEPEATEGQDSPQWSVGGEVTAVRWGRASLHGTHSVRPVIELFELGPSVCNYAYRDQVREEDLFLCYALEWEMGYELAMHMKRWRHLSDDSAAAAVVGSGVGDRGEEKGSGSSTKHPLGRPTDPFDLRGRSTEQIDVHFAEMMEVNARICVKAAANQSTKALATPQPAAGAISWARGWHDPSHRESHSQFPAAPPLATARHAAATELKDPRSQWWRAAAHAWRSHQVGIIISITVSQLEFASLSGDVQYCLVLYVLFCLWWRLRFAGDGPEDEPIPAPPCGEAAGGTNGEEAPEPAPAITAKRATAHNRRKCPLLPDGSRQSTPLPAFDSPAARDASQHDENGGAVEGAGGCTSSDWKTRALQWLEAYTGELYARKLHVPINELLLIFPEITQEPCNPVQPKAAEIAYEKQMTYVYCGNCPKSELVAHLPRQAQQIHIPLSHHLLHSTTSSLQQPASNKVTRGTKTQGKNSRATSPSDFGPVSTSPQGDSNHHRGHTRGLPARGVSDGDDGSHSSKESTHLDTSQSRTITPVTTDFNSSSSVESEATICLREPLSWSAVEAEDPVAAPLVCRTCREVTDGTMVCGAVRLPNNATCRRCRNTMAMTCVVCEEVVEGLYYWLRSCGHGGHVHHMEAWMQLSNECPKCGEPVMSAANS